MSDFYFHEHNVQQPQQPARQQYQGVSREALDGFFAAGSASAGPRMPSRQGIFADLPDAVFERLQQNAVDFFEKGAKSGVNQTFLDGLDRVPKKSLKQTDECAICATAYLDQEYPLVVRLPCNSKHHFDLECIGPWLIEHSTCPMCRTDFNKKKQAPPPAEDEEDEDDLDYMYG